MKKKPLTWIGCFAWTSATALIVVSSIGAFNIAVDPMSVFSSPKVTGFNAIKPHLDHDRELSRWKLAQSKCADIGIFGNSRAEMGINPENPIFKKIGVSTFNHAIPGSRVSLVYSQLNWLKSVNCMPKKVFLGVEFFDFLGGAKARSLLLPEVINPPRIDGKFLGESVLSMTGFKDSISTITIQRAKNAAVLTELGFNPALDYVSEVQRNGHYALFRQRAEESSKKWSKKLAILSPMSGGLSDDQNALNATLQLLRESPDTKVYVIIYPYHAQLRMMVERLGLGELFGEWKRYLANSTTAHAGKSGNIELWDFSGISSYNSEDVPVRGDKSTKLKYYWEAGHFKEMLGGELISAILGERPDFGIRVDVPQIEQWLSNDRRNVQALLQKPSKFQIEVDDVVSKVRPVK
jgi:hypothetical protein